MVKAVELPRFFHRLDIRGVFDGADNLSVARSAGAENARVLVGDVIANGALADFFFRLADRVGKSERLAAIRAQQVKREPLRGLLSDAGQAFQLVNQTRN